ncbi:MAG: AMP-binding protein [Actinobacteria bacterium]|nr:AMP-binding protein [Actinomycetota bacterium]
MTANALLSKEAIEGYRQQGLWNAATLVELANQARGPHPAVVCQRNGTITYSEMNEEASRLSQALADEGIGPGSVVCLQIPNWYEFVLSHLALTHLGAVTLPVLPSFRSKELEYIINTAQVSAVIGSPTFGSSPELSLYMELAERCPSLRFWWAAEDPEEGVRRRAGAASDRTPDVVNFDDLTILVATSGTTGDPKLVGHSHRSTLGGVLGKIAREIVGLTEDDVILMPSPLSHMTGLLYGVRMTILLGATLVLMDRWEPEQAADLMERHQVTYMQGATPFLFDLVRTDPKRTERLASLSYFTCGGAPIPETLAQSAVERFPQISLMAAWGLSETGTVTLVRPDDPIGKVTGTDGATVPGWEVRIVDSEGEPVEVGQEGEIECRGAALFHGYYMKRDLTESAMRNGWFRTGDRGRLDQDGYLRCLDRLKDIVIRGGLNISPIEIEELLRRHPKVKDVAVVGTPDDRLGERICAVVVPDGVAPSLDEVVQFLTKMGLSKQKLPESIVEVGELPTSPTGKVQKFLLRKGLAG